MPEPKILLFDIETSLTRVYVFDLYPKHGGTNVVEIDEPWYMLSFSWKWLGQKHTSVASLPDFPGYAKNKSCDKALVTELHRLISEADIIIAHNGDRFDLRKSNARFIDHGLAPPEPYKTVDTLKIARKHFKFDSNRLDDLGAFLGVGRKLATTGKALWLGCMAGDPKSWEKMRRYNKRDVKLLEAVYLKLRPWTTTHPNLDHFTRADACPVCQGKKLVHHGWNYTAAGKRQRMTCTSCGHRFTTGKLIKAAA